MQVFCIIITIIIYSQINPTNISRHFVNSLNKLLIKIKGRTDQTYWNLEIRKNRMIKIKYLSEKIFVSGKIFFLLEEREFFFDKNSIFVL